MPIEQLKDGRYFFTCGISGHRYMVGSAFTDKKKAEEQEKQHIDKYHNPRNITNLPNL